MVSKANDDFPDPERPVNTISFSRGNSTVRFLRLCSRAPLMSIESVDNYSAWYLSYDSVIRFSSNTCSLPERYCWMDTEAGGGGR